MGELAHPAPGFSTFNLFPPNTASGLIHFQTTWKTLGRVAASRIVKGQIQSSECGQGLVDKHLYFSFAADICLNEKSLTASLSNSVYYRPSFIVTRAANNNLCSRLSQLPGRGLANARGSASNQCALFRSQA